MSKVHGNLIPSSTITNKRIPSNNKVLFCFFSCICHLFFVILRRKIGLTPIEVYEKLA